MQALLTVPTPVPEFNTSILKHEHNIPTQFIWPDDEKPGSQTPPELQVPPIDLGGFLSGDPVAVSNSTRLANEACKKHGFFLVFNHGVDSKLLAKAHEAMDVFFEQPFSQKQRALRKQGDHCGYASSFVGRFATKLPWKETLSFPYSADHKSSNMVEDYFFNKMGSEFQEFG